MLRPDQVLEHLATALRRLVRWDGCAHCAPLPIQDSPLYSMPRRNPRTRYMRSPRRHGVTRIRKPPCLRASVVCSFCANSRIEIPSYTSKATVPEEKDAMAKKMR